MKRLCVVIAIAALAACDAPWAGPALPDGAQGLSLKQLSLDGPFDVGPDVIVATSLAQVRDAVVAHAKDLRRGADPCDGSSVPDRCWTKIKDQSNVVYVAVITNYECTRATKDATGLGGHTLYLIHWIGKAQSVCSASLALASWRLYSVSRGELPKTGTLTVRLEFQGDEKTVIESKVALS